LNGELVERPRLKGIIGVSYELKVYGFCEFFAGNFWCDFFSFKNAGKI
jgi:hypothetical protein